MALSLYIRSGLGFGAVSLCASHCLVLGIVCVCFLQQVPSPLDPFLSFGCANMFVMQRLSRGRVLGVRLGQCPSRLTDHGI